MSTITKEWLQQKIADMEAARDEIPFGMDEDDSKTLAAMKLALASLKAEAVAWRNKDSGHCGTVLIQGKSPIDCGYEPLYLAPPAPVSVPDITALDNLAGEMLNHAMNCERRVSVAYTHCAHRLAEEVRDLRAAMLQGAEPVKTAYNSPGDFESFISWLTSGDGIPDWLINGDKLDDEKTSFLLQVYRAGSQDANGKKDEGIFVSKSSEMSVSNITIDESQRRNSPVIPDGWVACSERMPDNGGKSRELYLCWGTFFDGAEPDYIPAWFFIHPTNGWCEWQPMEDDCVPEQVTITHWQPLPAAPQQEDL